MWQCLLYCAFDVELKIVILNSIENQDPYMFVPSTEPFLRNIELSHKFFQIFNLKSTTFTFEGYFHHNNATQAHKCIVDTRGDIE